MGNGSKKESRFRKAWRVHGFGLFRLVISEKLRDRKARRLGMKIGERTKVLFPIDLRYPEHIEIGRDGIIGARAFLAAGPNSRIKIGDEVLFAPGIHINTTMHNYEDPDTPIRLQGSTEKDVVIGSDVWIGTNAVILQGVTVGNGAVVGAAAVVKEDVAPYTVVAGVPAKFVKRRGEGKSRKTNTGG